MIPKIVPYDQTLVVLVNRSRLWHDLILCFLGYGMSMGLIYYFFAKGLYSPLASHNQAIALVFATLAFLAMAVLVRLVLEKRLTPYLHDQQRARSLLPPSAMSTGQPPYPIAEDRKARDEARLRELNQFGGKQRVQNIVRLTTEALRTSVADDTVSKDDTHNTPPGPE